MDTPHDHTIKRLCPRELLFDDGLIMLSRDEPGWRRGVISNDRQGLLILALHSICSELLAYRAAARIKLDVPFPNPSNRAEEIANTRVIGNADLDEPIEGLTPQDRQLALAEAIIVRVDRLAELTAEILADMKKSSPS